MCNLEGPLLLILLLFQFSLYSLTILYTIFYRVEKRKHRKKITVILLCRTTSTTITIYTAILHTDGFDTKFLSSHWPHYKSCHSRVRPFFYASVSPYHPLYYSLLHTKSYYRHTVFNHLKPCCTPTYKTPNFLGFSFPKKECNDKCIQYSILAFMTRQVVLLFAETHEPKASTSTFLTPISKTPPRNAPRRPS